MILSFAVCLPPFLWLCLHKENSLPLVALEITRVFKTLYFHPWPPRMEVSMEKTTEALTLCPEHLRSLQPRSWRCPEGGWQLCSVEGLHSRLEENPRGWSLSSQVGEAWGAQRGLAL